MHFNPRPPHGRRPRFKFASLATIKFQSTPPSREATGRRQRTSWDTRNFNPRPPHGRRLGRHETINNLMEISIHAPLTGGDDKDRRVIWTHTEFQSTPPSREATYLSVCSDAALFRFQSTPPSREATGIERGILALSDDFNPRPPHGRRRITSRT